MTDNKRTYIGNVVLDEENKTMLKNWLIDIMNSVQGHGNGFDADTVDGYHAANFATAEQGALAETALQQLTIGTTTLYNTSGAQYIKTDGVQIDTLIRDTLITVFSDLTDETSLSTLLIKLYNNYQNQINNLNENKVDKVAGKQLSTEDFTTAYKDMLDDLDFSFVDITCPKEADPSEQQLMRVLNAGSVNGLRFILTTDTLYAQYTNDVKNAWNNVFIFVDESKYPSDYESPLDCPIETGYCFRIDDDRPDHEVWLQYKGRLAVNWLDMIEISDLYNQFIEYGSFETKMQTIANTIVTAAIGNIDTPEHFNSIIKRITAPTIDHWNEYPFLSSDLSFVYDVVKDDESLCTPDDNGFLIADLSSITNDIETEVNTIKNNYNNLLTKVNANTSNISSLQNSVDNPVIDSALDDTNHPVANSVIKREINALNSSISSLTSQISALRTDLNNAKYFNKYLVFGVGQYNGTKRPEFKTPTDQQSHILDAFNSVSYVNGQPSEAKLSVTKRGSIKNADGSYKYNNPDYIYCRVIQEHTGKNATSHTNPYIFFQINGVAYARKIQEGTDYAILNIRLDPGTYQINAIYVDTSGTYEFPIYATQQVVVEN